MNIQELIKKYEEKYETVFGFPVIQLNQILEDLKQLDEPQKVQVPQFVADYIEYAKEVGWNLLEAMKNVPYEDNTEFRMWFYKSGNVEVFARAWLDGYEVEKEKRYRVNVKNVRTRQGTLNRSKGSGAFIFSNPEENNLYGTKFTRTELEEAGFGWVFDCTGVEIEEVE